MAAGSSYASPVSAGPASSCSRGGGAGPSLRDEKGVENWLDSIRQAEAFTFELEGE